MADDWQAIDRNERGSLTAVSSIDLTTIVRLVADPVTHRLLVDNSGSGIAGYQQPLTGVVNGVNQTFTWAVAPNVICVDQGRNMQAVSSDTTVNWTGTTTTVLAIAPTFDIFGVN